MRHARHLTYLLAKPETASQVIDWTGILSMARAESLLGTLACRLKGQEVPGRIEPLFEAARRDAEQVLTAALWEAEMARRALARLGIPVILLKGTAYAAAGLLASHGRLIGDLDIMVPRKRLGDVEAALLGAGWEWVKDDPYDQLYYRRWMHELPPLIHRERDRMIDVHHTILPLTARVRPQAAAMITDSVELPSGLRVLCPEDMVLHGVAHLFADGDLAGGLRNLWDFDRLVREFWIKQGFAERLEARARLHGLEEALGRAMRLARRLYGTPWQQALAGRPRASDRLYERRLVARNGWGQAARPFLRLAFYVRSHWLRMPPHLLARHLWIKARRSVGGASAEAPRSDR